MGDAGIWSNWPDRWDAPAPMPSGQSRMGAVPLVAQQQSLLSASVLQGPRSGDGMIGTMGRASPISNTSPVQGGAWAQSSPASFSGNNGGAAQGGGGRGYGNVYGGAYQQQNNAGGSRAPSQPQAGRKHHFSEVAPPRLQQQQQLYGMQHGSTAAHAGGYSPAAIVQPPMT